MQIGQVEYHCLYSVLLTPGKKSFFAHMIAHNNSFLNLYTPPPRAKKHMFTQQSHTQQAPSTIPQHFETCFVAAANYKRASKINKYESERSKEREINSRRDVCGNLMASVSFKKALISTSGPQGGPLCRCDGRRY